MSRRNESRLESKLSLPIPSVSYRRDKPPTRSPSVSPPSSCVSLELDLEDDTNKYSSSPEATSMVLVGCSTCLMYVMLAEEDPKCPKCKSTVLLDVIQEKSTSSTKRNNK